MNFMVKFGNFIDFCIISKLVRQPVGWNPQLYISTLFKDGQENHAK